MLKRSILLAFGLFWSAITCTFLTIVTYGAVHQWRALSFATTEGVVDSIKLTEASGESTSYSVNIAYHFDVNHRRYTGNRVRYAQGQSSDSWATDISQRFPAGSHPNVYYNPANPSDAVLIAGIQGEDLYLALFVTPFVMMMAGIWWGIAISFRKPRRFRGLRILEEGATTRIRPSCWWAVGIAGVSFGASALVSAFVVGLMFRSSHPPVTAAEATWMMVLAIAAIAGAATWFVIRSGKYDITLDLFRRTLTAPRGITIAYKDINQVNVLTRIQASSDGPDSRSYEVCLNVQQNGDARNIKLKSWLQQDGQARKFAAWLAEELGVEAQAEPNDKKRETVKGGQNG